MRQSRIVLPEAPEPSQQNLFAATGVSEDGPDPFPKILYNADGIKRVIASSVRERILGLDFEFNPKTGKPSILGVGSREPLAAAVPWDRELADMLVKLCLEHSIKIVGHNSFGTEKVLLEKNLNRTLPLSMFEDTMLEHYLLNQDFCKSTEKEEDEGSLGFMNLWNMASMTTVLPQWKICRQRACEGPCPRHDVFGYCAIDAYASVEGHAVMMDEMTRWKVPYKFYREIGELSEICYQMETAGLRIDLPYVDQLNRQMDDAKEALFPHEMNGKAKVYEYFNPRSRDQILNWFGKHGFHFKATEKKYIQKVLEKQGIKAGHADIKEYLDFLQDHPPTGALAQLYALYQFKSSGKGCDPWFGEKYRDGDYIHPRFIVPGTCTGRLASSRPNFTNIPSRGWGTAIKKAIIPRNEDEEFLEVDAAQLELRCVMYLAGMDPSVCGDDAFKWLVQEGHGKFETATKYAPNLTARDIAKSVAYGSLYGEGIKLLTDADLSSARVQKDIANGCLRVYDDWTFRGKHVAFTGKNLAERFFGNWSDENRKTALEIQEDLYFATFPILRTWHKKVSREVEDNNYVRSPSGRFLRLYGEDTDDIKMGFSFLGQGCGADHIQAIMIEYKRQMGVIPDLMVHDSLVFSIKKSWTDKQCLDFLQPMFSETFRFPGLAVPGKPKRGPNYGSLKAIA